MKKVLFWILFIPLGILDMVLLTIGGLCESYDNMLHAFEGWCFDYTKYGWIRKGGLWTKEYK